jgi:DNA (cytosine-5)-methyltransferase 1
MQNKNKQMMWIDLFAGAGGMSLGAELAGVKVIYAIEKNPFAAETYKLNHPNTTVFVSDIKDITEIPIFDKSMATILFGGPPCQGFSSSNRRTNNTKNENNWLYKEFIRILKMISPDFLVFENVTGIVSLNKGEFFRDILQEFNDIGYNCTSAILNAVNFGVPQNRDRMFIVGSKNKIHISLETVTVVSPQVTVNDAIYDLPSLVNGANCDILPYKKDSQTEYVSKMRENLTACTGHLVSKNAEYVLRRYEHIKQGENWRAIPNELMTNYTDSSRCHSGIYHRLRGDAPSVVIGNYRKNMLIHPTENRGLSIREAARIQSFPDKYVFCGGIGSQQQQVGNSVPPLLAKYVFEKIMKEV